MKKALERMSEAFSYLFFNENPNYVVLAEIGYSMFMWRKLQIFTLHFLDNLVLTEISVAELFLQLKKFLMEESKKLYEKSVGEKLNMLSYKWKNQVKASRSKIISNLVEQVELQGVFLKMTRVF
ncbi:hypothetical protein [Bacillus luti]|uniref:hypothetical protein n=1 Tax=Bacillus luti TaxID=2026191 RepID=UPI0012E89F23|nr:hypothetical protein [Bacillus luti]